MTERLTTLAAVKGWLGIDNTSSDDQLTRLIDAASRFALNYMNRDSLAGQDFTQNFMGNGKQNVLIRNWPVISVASVGVSGSLVPASSLGTGGMPSEGYRLSDQRSAPQSIDLWGYWFYYRAPCQVVYRAGFETSQTDVIPDSVTITPTTSGQWIENISVTIDSVVAVLVSSGPTAGQYMVDEWGTYTFADADAGKTSMIFYSYAPSDVAQGVNELIGEWYLRRDRIGVKSKMLAGQETVTFTTDDMNDSVRGMLQPYRNVIPV